MFYSVGFVILVPLIFTIGATTRLPLLYIGLPMLAALSVTHGYLPPHPAPTALAAQFGADIGTTMIYGLIVAIPAIILGGPIFATTLKKYKPKPLEQFMNTTPMTDAEMPGVAVSIFTALLPVFLIGTSALLKFFLSDDSIFMPMISIFGDPAIAMIISVVVAIYTLGIGQGRSLVTVGESFESAIKGIAMILLIIAGAGALKSILVESQISDYIGNQLAQIAVSPLILAWGIAALIRICVGSATVAGLTSAGIVAPLIPLTGADPNLMVLATGAGSLMFSHINDSGFWLFKEFFNMSVVDTLKTWSIMETIVSVAGLIGVLSLNFIIN
jgi:Gnt-I system high-affinity gluconate transporter